jgi:hypothetical protein
MNMRTGALVALVAAIAGLTGFLISRNLIPFGKTCTEPVANVVCTFNGNNTFTSLANQKAFIDSLASATFRHNMVIVDDNHKCQQPPGMGDIGLTNCQSIDPCTSSGQMNLHVTQRVGFNNLSDLKKALDYLSPL